MIEWSVVRSLLILLISLFLFHCGAPQPDEETVRSVDMQEQVLATLRANCYSCHGEDDSSEGNFGFVLNLDFMITRGYIVVGDAAGSPLYQRMIATDGTIMPPSGAMNGNAVERIRIYIDTLDGE